MLLGKRARPAAMKRNTSMTELTLDHDHDHSAVNSQPSDPHTLNRSNVASPRLHRRNSAAFVDTAQFLRTCSMCQRRLVPGRDIYMYKGDSAFCSLECRHQQITQDERKEKLSLPLNKEAATSATATAGERIAAM